MLDLFDLFLCKKIDLDLLVKQSKEILQDAEKYIKEKHTDYKRQNDLIFVGRSLGSIVAGSEGRVVASMIDCGTGFEVVNKDLLICNLSKNSSIEIKMRVQRFLDSFYFFKYILISWLKKHSKTSLVHLN